MDLDFASIKALSSPTRIRILKQLLNDDEVTPTELSNRLGKSKSTISSHVSKLEAAGLVEKDKEEGRRRVIYHPTRKATTIMKGKERKVRFSVASAVFSLGAGIGLGWWKGVVPDQAQTYATETAPALQTFDTQAAGDGARAMAQQAPEAMTWDPVFLGVAGVFVLIAVILLYYAYLFHSLPSRQ